MPITIQNFIPKFIRQVLDNKPKETITADRWNELWNLAITQGDWNSEAVAVLCEDAVQHKTSAEHDGRYYTESEINSMVALLATKAENDLKANKADVYTKPEINQYLQGGDTVIRREVFTISNANNGDGTFTYTDENSVAHTGTIGTYGEQIFTLLKGSYLVGQERIEAVVNDTLQRSVTSGGLIEVDVTHVGLASPEGAGAEITFKYFEKVALAGLGLIALSTTQPGVESVWFKVV